ncbi:HET-domain-containing protein, partial [Thozetella sp. PMI_491]
MLLRGNDAFIQLLSHSIYDALESEFKQIRLVRLDPQSTAVAEIRCRLLTVSLENPPAYQALSYVWGDSRNRQIIYIDGICLPVTLNLAAALQRLRHPHEEVVLWIDAICIDQSNLSERSSQVKMMGEIYRAAQRVLAWLGEEVDGSRAAFAFMKNDLVHRWNPKNTASRAFSDTRESLLALFGRPYWWRVWTQQEM